MANDESVKDKSAPALPQKAADFREIYVNHARLAITQFDLVVMLGHVVEGTNGETFVEEQIALRVSPQFCKALSLNLANAVTVWETQFGIIPSSGKTQESAIVMPHSPSDPKKKS